MEMLSAGCKHCPVKDCQTIQYRGSACSAARARAGADFDPLTHGERLRRVSDTELAAFLQAAKGQSPPWCSKPNCGKPSCLNCIQTWLETSVAAPKTATPEKVEEE